MNCKRIRRVRVNKRIIVTISSIALLICLMASTALAGTYATTMSISRGCTDYLKSGAMTLNDDYYLNGTLQSYSTSTGTSAMYGNISTKGSMFIHIRDYGNVSPGCSDYLGWSPTDTGTFWAEIQATDGNHDGYCRAYQAY